MSQKPILRPGILAPEFTHPAVNWDQEVTLNKTSSRTSVILFFGLDTASEIGIQLSEYQERLHDFESRKAQVIAVSTLSSDELKKLADEKKLAFPLISIGRSSELASGFGVTSDTDIATSGFIVDQEGLVRRVFQSEANEGLPSSAVVLRALTNLANIPKPPASASDDWRLGSADAPITIIEYGDYQCKHCREFYHSVMQLLSDYQAKVQFIFRHFPMRHAHPLAILAAQAAEAAGLQDKFWEMHARLFAANDALERENLILYAQELGLDMTKFNSDIDSSIVEDAVMEDYRTGTKHKIKSPPTLFVNGILFDGLHTAEALKAKIDELLACL